jgi:DNA-binding LacI/PurR family transcriptional regulator
MEIHKIVKEVNLSRSVITQSLHGKSKGDPNYIRIVKAMSDLNIQLNTLEKLQSQHRVHTIGVVTRDFTDDFFDEFIEAIQHTADSSGYGVLFVRKHNDTKSKVDYIALLDEKVDGFIFLGEETSRQKEVEQLMAQGVPCIMIQGQKSLPNATYLNIDNVKAAYEAMSHLVKLGHKRIIHITGPMALYEVVERNKGYEKAIVDYQLEYQQKINVSIDYESIFDLGCKIATRLKSERLTAAFCYNDFIATALMDGLMEQGVIIPRDFSIVGFDDISFRHLSHNWVPKLSSIKQPQKEMAHYAVSKLIEMMESKSIDASKTFEGVFIERDSTSYL